ncbi:acyl-CoA carboxylase epsilon subunit [Streptomyces sp. NPDC002701]|uniref:acyl-CoA carboxylase epsilon subunit n=1 Tax=unclassified Streptomyces TaxID=2593676 RepID=UPI0036899406
MGGRSGTRSALRVERGRADETELAAVAVVVLALYGGERPCATPAGRGPGDWSEPRWRRDYYRAPGGWR